VNFYLTLKNIIFNQSRQTETNWPKYGIFHLFYFYDIFILKQYIFCCFTLICKLNWSIIADSIYVTWNPCSARGQASFEDQAWKSLRIPGIQGHLESPIMLHFKLQMKGKQRLPSKWSSSTWNDRAILKDYAYLMSPNKGETGCGLSEFSRSSHTTYKEVHIFSLWMNLHFYFGFPIALTYRVFNNHL